MVGMNSASWSAVMAEQPPKFDARLEEGVKYLEEMLELMPDDRTTLEFLVVAYEQLKEPEKSRKIRSFADEVASQAGRLCRRRGSFAALVGDRHRRGEDSGPEGTPPRGASA